VTSVFSRDGECLILFRCYRGNRVAIVDPLADPTHCVVAAIRHASSAGVVRYDADLRAFVVDATIQIGMVSSRHLLALGGVNPIHQAQHGYTHEPLRMAIE